MQDNRNVCSNSSQDSTVLLTKAQAEFIAPENNPTLNSLNFETWYHPEDIHRIVWAITQSIPDQIQSDYYSPQIIMDQAPPLFEATMIYCRDTLAASQKKYLPFIMKPEIGGAHFTAGILRKDIEGNITLFFFNPLGYRTDEELKTAQRRLKLIDIACIDGMPVICSPHKVQDLFKEGDSIVSCGPICVMFIEYALRHPEWIDRLDKHFHLPEELSQLLDYDKETYQRKLLDVRKKHFDLLGNVANEQLKAVNSAYFPSDRNFTDRLRETHKAMKNDQYRYQDQETEFYIFLLCTRQFFIRPFHVADIQTEVA